MSSFELIPLFSGSSGNSTLIKVNGKNILIDAGKNCKHVKAALDEVGMNPADIDAIFITHSHSDHIAGIDVFIRNFKTKHLFATSSTHHVLSRKFSKPHPDTEDIVVVPGETIDLGDGVTVECCSTPHDAHGSCCYKINYSDRSAMVMTDLGFVSDDIRKMALGVDGVLIESNYDRRMLVYGPYPEDLKIRIASDRGHLSNDDCAEMMKEMISNGTVNFILGHLSETNNTPEKAYSTVTDYLSKFGLNQSVDYNIAVANRHCPTRGISIL